MTPESSAAVDATLTKFRQHFGFDLCRANLNPEFVLRSPPSRDDLAIHFLSQCDWSSGERQFDYQEMRRWLLAEGVMLVQYPAMHRPMYLIAPIISVCLSTAYHATARKNLEAIWREGLLPGCSGQGRASTGPRFDCEGNIYVCLNLGIPDDAGRAHSYSAHWWRDELSRTSGEGDWVILQVDRIETIPGLVTNRDFMSDSGVILTGVNGIPPKNLNVIWPSGTCVGGG